FRCPVGRVSDCSSPEITVARADAEILEQWCGAGLKACSRRSFVIRRNNKIKSLMVNNPSNTSSAVSRRQFIKTSSFVAASAAAAVSFPSVVGAQSKQPINAVIIGVGGRGGGAGENFNEAVKNLGVDGKIVAVADLFPEAAQKAK